MPHDVSTDKIFGHSGDTPSNSTTKPASFISYARPSTPLVKRLPSETSKKLPQETKYSPCLLAMVTPQT